MYQNHSYRLYLLERIVTYVWTKYYSNDQFLQGANIEKTGTN